MASRNIKKQLSSRLIEIHLLTPHLKGRVLKALKG